MIGANDRRILSSIRTVANQHFHHCQPDRTPKPVHPGLSRFADVRPDLFGHFLLGLWSFRKQIENDFVKSIGILSICSKSRHTPKYGFDAATFKRCDVSVE